MSINIMIKFPKYNTISLNVITTSMYLHLYVYIQLKAARFGCVSLFISVRIHHRHMARWIIVLYSPSAPLLTNQNNTHSFICTLDTDQTVKFTQ